MRRQVQFVGAEFTSDEVDFSWLEEGWAALDFYRTSFVGTKIDFSGAVMRGGAFRFDQCDFDDSDLAFSFAEVVGVSSRLQIERCRFTVGVIGFESSADKQVMVFVSDTRFEAVEFVVTDYPTGDQQFWLNVRDEELVDTVLPAKHVRRPTVDPV